MNDLSNPVVLPSTGSIMPSGAVAGAFKVDTSRGTRNGTVSAQWASRPADERFLNLTDLLASVEARKMASFEEVIPAGKIHFQGDLEEFNKLVVMTPGGQEVVPTHYSIGQLGSLAKIGAATGMLRAQPGFLAAANLNWALKSHIRDTPLKAYGDTNSVTLRAATGPTYGRIYDADVVKMIMKVAGNGIGDTQWKVPGVLDWSSMRHNPYVDITNDTTTLFASDRDMFVFLVDDTHPIEIGKLADGSPDLVFRGFYVTNSETGNGACRMATMWLRAVCQNRNLWGTENFEEIKIIHSAGGPEQVRPRGGPCPSALRQQRPHRVAGWHQSLEGRRDRQG
jgi:hypothetical protein